MGIVTSLVRSESRASVEGPLPLTAQRIVEWLTGEPSIAGVNVSVEGSLKLAAVWACVRVISEDIASLPLITYRRMEQGKERAGSHRLYRILHDEPNPFMTAMQLRETMQGHILTWGNAYANIERDDDGKPIALWPLRPDRMDTPIISEAETLLYTYHLPSGEPRSLTQSEVFHLRGLSPDGIMGYSPIRMHREALALSLATMAFGNRFFSNDSRPGGVLQVKNKLSKEAADRMKTSWEAAHQGLTKSHRVAVLEEGVEWKQVGIPPEDSQWLQCAVPGTLVTMADGTRRPVELLDVGDAVLAWDAKLVSARVSAIGEPFAKPLVRITTARGRTITVSHDHPFLTQKRLRTPGNRPSKSPDEWVFAKALQVGNYVRAGLGMAESVPDASLDFNTAWFLGAMVGDGYIRKAGFSFSNDDEGVLVKMREVLMSLGGDLADKRRNVCDWDIHTNGNGRGGSPLRSLVNESGLVGKHSGTKQVPEMVWKGGREAWAGFLTGYLDTDGSVGPPKGKLQPKVYWSSINRVLLEECQHLLALLAIQSAIYRMQPGGEKRVFGYRCLAQPTWGLVVTGRSQLRQLADTLRPAHSERGTRLAAFAGLPDSQYRQPNWMYDRIICIEELPAGDVIPVEVAGCHTHITNGLITHNTREFQIQETARIFRMPPHKIQDLSRATYANIESQSIQYVTDTLRPWLVRWEQQVNKDLVMPGERGHIFAEHLMDALLRGETLSRFQSYQYGIQNGIYSPNEVREFENLNPFDGGNLHLQQANMVPYGTKPGQKQEPKPE